MAAPEFWIVAGSNGAGKTSCVSKEPVRRLIPTVTFLNPDDRTLDKLRAAGHQGFRDAPADVQLRLFLESADEVFEELRTRLNRAESVGIETVLSTSKYESLVEQVVCANGFVGLIYVALSSPAIAKDRVAARVRRGGHGVPEDKIEQRWQRSLDYLPQFAAKVTKFWVVDNSGSMPDVDPILVATGTFGKLDSLEGNTFPELNAALLKLPRATG
jgi:predicted ABC-type ATPase